jgi:two-component system cell cycle sensor histidine kinase/response regulator CckA
MPNEIVQSVVLLTGKQARQHKVTFNVTLAEDLPLINVDSEQIKQVLINLFSNAKDAVDPGRPGVIRVSSEKTPGGCLIRVADNGSGMEPDVQAKLFSPFFTTKETGKGTGLGLGICLSIIQEMGGAISVRSTPGSGTEFTLELPGTSAEAGAERVSAPREAVTGLSGRILVVEDEEDLRKVIVKNLLKRGLLAEAVADGEAALERLRSSGYDVVLTDLKMRNCDGSTLIAKMKELGRREKIILMSGAVEMETRRIAERADAVLRKPFLVAELLDVLKSQLTQS